MVKKDGIGSRAVNQFHGVPRSSSNCCCCLARAERRLIIVVQIHPGIVICRNATEESFTSLVAVPQKAKGSVMRSPTRSSKTMARVFCLQCRSIWHPLRGARELQATARRAAKDKRSLLWLLMSATGITWSSSVSLAEEDVKLPDEVGLWLCKNGSF